MTERRLLRLIAQVQRNERNAMRQADSLEAAACTIEASGYLAWGAAMRRIADAVRDADRESTKAYMGRIHELRQEAGL